MAAMAPRSEEGHPKVDPVKIKKYANRRLYNTQSSSYVTLENLSQMVREGVDFVVQDAKTGEDLTRQVLTQIIVELEGKGQNLLPIGFLRQLIGFYGDSLQSLLPNYLELSMHAFSQNQERMRDSLTKAFGGFFPFGPLEEMGKKNVQLFEQAMSMFAPFDAKTQGSEEKSGPADPKALDELRTKLEKLQEQINSLTRR
jgi:polyhydroxyalkanoate synthesis repressor PhaR